MITRSFIQYTCMWMLALLPIAVYSWLYLFGDGLLLFGLENAQLAYPLLFFIFLVGFSFSALGVEQDSGCKKSITGGQSMPVLLQKAGLWILALSPFAAMSWLFLSVDSFAYVDLHGYEFLFPLLSYTFCVCFGTSWGWKLDKALELRALQRNK